MDVDELLRTLKSHAVREERQRQQRQTLRELGLSTGLEPKEVLDAIREINEGVAKCLQVERASVWLYEPDRSAIRCIDLFERTPNRHSAGVVLYRDDFPAYFDALGIDRAIVAEDAHRDPATHEFSATYLSVHGISSMLDAPIRAGGQLLGVICHEHVGPVRRWEDDEISFASHVADLVSLSIASDERRKAARALEESQNRLRLALSATGVGVWDWYPQEGRLVWDPVVHRMVGLPPERFRGVTEDFMDLVHPDDLPGLREALEYALVVEDYDTDFRIIDATTGQVRAMTSRGKVFRDAEGRPVRVMGVIFDVSERREAEARRRQLELQLLHTQKLEALGVLAGGIAHDFNNILVGVVGNASLALLDTEPGSALHSSLSEIYAASQRAAELCRQLLAYAGRSPRSTVPVDLRELVTDLQPLIRTSVSKIASVEWRLRAVPAVIGDPVQLQQVVMNLLINASEAIEDESGKVTVESGVVELGREALAQLRGAQDAPPGRYVFLSVSDTGHGMDPETLDRIFDPFFSTKFAGRGLGLAAVLGIVRAHRGGLAVQSSKGEGTTFRLFFPASGEAPRPQRDREPVPAMPPPTTGRILVADDEPAVRAVAARALRRVGFEVVEARNGREAIEQFREDPHSFDCVLLDIIMPFVRGDHAMEQIRAIRPDVPVLLSSGFADEAPPISSKPYSFLPKPYSVAALVDAVRSAIEDH